MLNGARQAGRDAQPPVLAWRAGPRPHDHFELTRPYTGKAQEPVLLVTLKGLPAMGMPDKKGERAVYEAFAKVQQVAERDVPAGRNETRRVTFLASSGDSRAGVMWPAAPPYVTGIPGNNNGTIPGSFTTGDYTTFGGTSAGCSGRIRRMLMSWVRSRARSRGLWLSYWNGR